MTHDKELVLSAFLTDYDQRSTEALERLRAALVASRPVGYFLTPLEPESDLEMDRRR
jgi:hypothetical protein